MSGRSAHVEIFYWRTILCPAGRGPQEEELLKRQLTLKNVSFRQSELTFEIERRQHLSMQNYVFNIRSVFGDRLNHGVPKLFSLLVPGPFFQVIRRVLHKTRHHVLARRRHGWIG